MSLTSIGEEKKLLPDDAEMKNTIVNEFQAHRLHTRTTLAKLLSCKKACGK